MYNETTPTYYTTGNLYTAVNDPAVSIYTQEPDTLTVTYPSMISHGSSETVNVFVSHYMMPLYNAQVCLYKEYEIYDVKATNFWVFASFTGIEADTSGTLHVTVTRHNYVRHSGSIIVD